MISLKSVLSWNWHKANAASSLTSDLEAINIPPISCKSKSCPFSLVILFNATMACINGILYLVRVPSYSSTIFCKELAVSFFIPIVASWINMILMVLNIGSVKYLIPPRNVMESSFSKSVLFSDRNLQIFSANTSASSDSI